MIIKKLIAFFMLCLYMLGTIGGFGYCMMNRAYVIVVGVVGLAFMAWPTFIKYRNILMEDAWP